MTPLANPVFSVNVSGTLSRGGQRRLRCRRLGRSFVAVMAQAGAFPPPCGSLSAVLVLTVPPDVGYTISVSGESGATGVVLAEIYELP